jgi:hypothetical protein
MRDPDRIRTTAPAASSAGPIDHDVKIKKRHGGCLLLLNASWKRIGGAILIATGLRIISHCAGRNPWLHALTYDRENPEADMISPVQQKVSAWSIDPSLVPIMGPPPKYPDDDEDDNEEDDEDDGEEEEPAVIREPDEC